MKTVRYGECNRCGDCCRLLPSWKDLPDITRALFRMHDPHAEAVLKRVVNGKCAHLMRESNFTSICLLFDKDERPNFCKNFPMEPENLERLSNCTYYFKNIEEERKMSVDS